MSELVIDEPGSYLGVRKGLFYVKTRDGMRSEVAPVELAHISIRCRGVGVSADALRLACKFGVEITVYSRGRPVGKVLTALSGGGVLTRRAQLEAWQTERGLSVAKAIVYAKLHNQRLVLRQRGRELASKGLRVGVEVEMLADKIRGVMGLLEGAGSLDSVRAYEAQGAVSYWRGVGLLLPSELGFSGRTSWSPSDPFNKALNIGYGVLRSRVWSAVLSANLDPFVGFLHLPRGRHMCLVSDLMEEFRPGVVDRPLISLAVENSGAFLDDKLFERNVLKAVVQALQRNDGFYERAVVEQARRLASFLRGGVERYEGFRMRW
ncbi:MAG: CRISPR-associated endonuclease Cas1 [Candidatus Caldarchaeum sp.]|nr:CRISPR-associated endonuclease Cas1 [Candidatus Caldarchaeum sp.]MDW8360595.1 CRISPR-associated endonuclease Cas1 [Candidatus Caldarchaeum sp.]